MVFTLSDELEMMDQNIGPNSPCQNCGLFDMTDWKRYASSTENGQCCMNALIIQNGSWTSHDKNNWTSVRPIRSF